MYEYRFVEADAKSVEYITRETDHLAAQGFRLVQIVQQSSTITVIDAETTITTDYVLLVFERTGAEG